MNKLPTTKQNSNLALKRAKNLLSITDRILKKNSALTKEVFDHNIYVGLGHSSYIESVAITPDGKYIVSGSRDNTIKLWDIKSGEEIRTFEGHSRWVTSVAITPDGKYIVSGSDDKTIKLWDIKSGEEIAQFTSLEDGEWISLTKDGYYDCSENAYKYFNFQNNKEVITDKNHPIYKQRKRKNLLKDILL